ncbi:MAG: hypothetical protein DCE90_17310 [Pseudanabaena sp.]|nr:MAG: hypothetical protein DCE90_17310 [Pseudanabaena sp.]
MEQITIDLPKSITDVLATYAQEHQTSSSATVQKAIQQFLIQEGYLAKPKKPFRLSPATQGSGYTDTSINHDAVLAEFIYANKIQPKQL